MKQRNPIADYVAYAALRVASAFFGILPVNVSLSIARGMGTVWFLLPRRLPETRVNVPSWGKRNTALKVVAMPVKILASVSKTSNKLLGKFREHRNRAELHIRQSFPDMSTADVERLALESMRQLCLMAIELLLSPRLITRWTWHDYVETRNLGDAIRCLADKKGCILLTGHYGNIEILGTSLATIGFDISAVMRPLDNPHINKLLTRRRAMSGLKLLDKGGATQHAPEILESGAALAFIADQNAGSKGIFVDFFGRKASTYKSIGLLAMRFEVPVIVGCARRIGRDFKYEMHVNRVIHPEEWADKDDPLRWITQEYTTALEDLIRESPGQYLWIHRRWKTRPKDELESAA
ncbi:MAG: lysophospholipid acyltransferase family protein [Phycisphaerales bacterium]|nr:lysophospholipid acyltransferase family protein [Phycisphaerales bacterium]MCB9854821.1 lysophospholipid acyltransferase family protein [Phycisphaerales bacterium]MCB9863707.1 lysophospholipid acyltransferase family protein [Phycisphaerales bacterium]